MPSNHIEVRMGARRVEVVVDDWELFDYVEDVLVAEDLESDGFRSEERNGRTFYRMDFGEGVDTARLREVVDRIPSREVERIWALNNAGARMTEVEQNRDDSAVGEPLERATMTTLQQIQVMRGPQTGGDEL